MARTTACFLTLSLLLLGSLSASADYVPADCSVVLGELNPADFGTTGYSQPADTTVLFQYYTTAGTPLNITHLATELLDMSGPAHIRLAITNVSGHLLAQGVAPIALTSDIAAGVYTVALATPLVLQPSTPYYIAQLTDSDLSINFGGPFASPYFVNTLYADGMQSTYYAANIQYITEEAPVAALNCIPPPPNSSMMGDPQFVGLLGQSYQVHGIDGEIYNLISDRLLQVNARFTFLSSGGCDRDAVTGEPLYICFSHPGSYVTAIGLRTAAGDTVEMSVGGEMQGFHALLVNGRSVPTSTADAAHWPITLSSADSTLPSLTVSRVNGRTLTIAHAGLYTLTVQSSDSFLNIIGLQVGSMSRLAQSEQSHGLIGQTWQLRTDGVEVAAIEGLVDDYAEQRGELLGCAFLFNKFNCSSRSAQPAPNV